MANLQKYFHLWTLLARPPRCTSRARMNVKANVLPPAGKSQCCNRVYSESSALDVHFTANSDRITSLRCASDEYRRYLIRILWNIGFILISQFLDMLEQCSRHDFNGKVLEFRIYDLTFFAHLLTFSALSSLCLKKSQNFQHLTCFWLSWKEKKEKGRNSLMGRKILA